MRKIVCAAMKHSVTELVICGVRHYDMLMRDVISQLPDEYGIGDWHQGFVDNKGRFVNREEAMTIVTESGQMIDLERNGSPKHQLFSEGLY